MFLREIGYLKGEEARPIFQQDMSVVHFLHQRLIAYRHIKLEKILIDGAGKVKLCDFGNSACSRADVEGGLWALVLVGPRDHGRKNLPWTGR